MQNLYFEKLNDRILWIDGEVSLNKEQLCSSILSGNDITDLTVFQSDVEVSKFSKLTRIPVREKTAPDFSKIDDSFLLPESIKNIDLEKYFVRKLKYMPEFKNSDTQQKEKMLGRVFEELDLYSEKGLLDVLRTAIHIVTMLENENEIWGPGRGSACCSYLLFLIGLHDVDSIKFDLNISEFLR